MISYRQRPSSAAAISAITGAIFSASLRTGTTIETAMAAGSEEGKSHPFCAGVPIPKFVAFFGATFRTSESGHQLILRSSVALVQKARMTNPRQQRRGLLNRHTGRDRPTIRFL